MAAAATGILRLVAALVLAFALPAGALARDEGETEAEIQYLLDFVAASNCTFIRNGTAHDPVDAADHLRLKYGRGKRYVNSAEQFIDRLASQSSWTGKPYTVDCEGKTQPSKDWLYRALGEYRHHTGAIAPPAITPRGHPAAITPPT